jgi:hypothetical protein
MKRKILLAIIVVALGVMLTACGSLSNSVTQVANTLEINSEFDITGVFECKNDVTISLKDNFVDTSKLGEITVTVVVATDKKSEDVDYTFTVVDTEAPQLKQEHVSIYKGTEFNPENFVACTDNSGDEITAKVISNPVDTTVEGGYVVLYEATDASGNTAELPMIVTVDPIETTDDIRNIFDEYVTRKGYTNIQLLDDYSGTTLWGVVVSPVQSFTKVLDTRRVFTITPYIDITTLIHSMIIYVRVDFRDSSTLWKEQYNISSTGKDLTISNQNQSVTVTDSTGALSTSIGSSETFWIGSELHATAATYGAIYRFYESDIENLSQILNEKDVKIEALYKDHKDIGYGGDYESGTPVLMSYELSADDLEFMTELVDVYQYLKTVLEGIILYY